MPAKTTYTATFPDGKTITRKSHRAYQFAWRVRYDYDRSSWKNYSGPLRGTAEYDGFSANRRLAEKAARAPTGRDSLEVSNVRIEIVEVAA